MGPNSLITQAKPEVKVEKEALRSISSCLSKQVRRLGIPRKLGYNALILTVLL